MLLLAWKIFVKRRLIIRGNDCMGSEILAINSLKTSQFPVTLSYVHWKATLLQKLSEIPKSINRYLFFQFFKPVEHDVYG